MRKSRAKITASEAGIVTGVSKYSTPPFLWQIKVGSVTKGETEPDETQLHGITHEPLVRNLYSKIMACEVSPSPFRNHHDPAWREEMGAEPDGIVIESGTSRLIEIKCPFWVPDWKFIPPENMGNWVHF
eukprot:TRINITY_DN2126_c0_g1_i2.p1 TRINITY_DN2126_c0_g1~~TRINITY_DN2126_c0_g1_i2.p1  ORF type:complete len:129 (-),score=20.04 TRINITY_DN2126_c0_g1_i2:775-1161(-)